MAALLAVAAVGFAYLSMRLLRSWLREDGWSEVSALEAAAGLIFLLMTAMTVLALGAVIVQASP